MLIRIFVVFFIVFISSLTEANSDTNTKAPVADCTDLDFSTKEELKLSIIECQGRNYEYFKKIYEYILRKDSNATLTAEYEVCIKSDGLVSSVYSNKFSGDENLSNLLASYLWYIKFPKGKEPICFTQPFIFVPNDAISGLE